MSNLKKYLLIPFSRCNCWQLVRRIYADHGIALPEFDITADQAVAINQAVTRQRPLWRRLDAPKTPCVVLLRNDADNPQLCNHFGIYLDGRILHTLEKSGPATFKPDHPLWRHRIEGYYEPNL